MADHASAPEYHYSLTAAINIDIRWLAYIRSTTNIQNRWPICSPTTSWYPTWQPGKYEALQDCLDQTLRVFREHMEDPMRSRTTMDTRRTRILNTMFQVCRSLIVGLTWDEGFDILERWLLSKGRKPELYYRTLLAAVQHRLEKS
jgi:hypothetical protein